jgi:hypothetical protein
MPPGSKRCSYTHHGSNAAATFTVVPGRPPRLRLLAYGFALFLFLLGAFKYFAIGAVLTGCIFLLPVALLLMTAAQLIRARQSRVITVDWQALCAGALSIPRATPLDFVATGNPATGHGFSIMARPHGTDEWHEIATGMTSDVARDLILDLRATLDQLPMASTPTGQRLGV